MAPVESEPPREAGPTLAPAEIVIRNTFIDVCAKPQRGRSYSTPAVHGDMTEESPETCPSVDASTDASGEVGGKEAEDAEELPGVSASHSGSLMEESSYADPASAAPSPCSAPSLPDAAHAPSEGAQRSALSSKAQVWAPAAPFEDQCQTVGGARPSRAQAWKPTSVASAAEPQMSFEVEAQVVAEEVKMAVQLFWCCAGAEVHWEYHPGYSRSCSLVAFLRAEHLGYTERLLTTAKEAIFEATGRSSGVSLIGQKQVPFPAMPGGFWATLGEIGDEEQACWAMYNYGYCNRQNFCHWAHPRALVEFRMVVIAVTPHPSSTITPQQPYVLPQEQRLLLQEQEPFQLRPKLPAQNFY